MSEQKWISVKDKLPEIGIDKKYPYASDLVLLSDGDKVYCGYYEDSTIPEPKYGAKAFLDADGNDFEEADITITHWMPLPEPPKS